MQTATDEAEARPGRRVAGQDPAKRAQILEGAKRCFMQLGFEAASMNEITAESGVSKGTLYVYFKDKQDLFTALVDREKSLMMDAAHRELQRPGTTEQQLHRFGAYIAAALTSEEVIRAQRMVLGVADRMPDIAMRFFAGQAVTAYSILEEWLAARVATGELVIPDIGLAARQFLELSMASIYKLRLFGNMPEPASAAQVERVVDSAVDMFLGHYRKR